MPSVNGLSVVSRIPPQSDLDVVRVAQDVPLLSEYETVAASQTAQVLGGSGAAGDYIEGILVVPAAVGAGNVSLLDGSTSISIYATGTLVDLKPFYVELKMKSLTGPWKITTGASVSCIAVGKFT